MHSKPLSHPGNALVALLAVLLFLGSAALLIVDVMHTWRRSKPVPLAQRLAEENLKLVKDSGGWRPFAHKAAQGGKRMPAAGMVYDWEDNLQGWQTESEFVRSMGARLLAGGGVAGSQLPPGLTETSNSGPKAKSGFDASLSLADKKAVEQGNKRALAIPVNFPDPATICRSNEINNKDDMRMVGVRFIAYDVFVPLDCPGFVSCLFFMKDKDGLWYQARSRAALLPGEWTTVTADIRGGSPDVTPLGHLGQWDDNQASQIRTLGLTFYGDKPFAGKILVDNFRGWVPASKAATGSTAVANAVKEAPLRVFNLRTEPAAAATAGNKAAANPQVKKFETLTVRFELNRQAGNPFDPEQADITCLVEAPSKTVTEHIGFWYQDYDRSDRFAGDELAPIGRPEWRVRITPREVGEYKYTLKVRMKQDETTLPPQAFTALPSDAKGFVRVAKSDPHFFEFENGDFYYPIGHNLHSPVDMRCWKEILKSEAPAGRGLPMYDDFFPKMKAAGENTAEVWMASWWLGIEWTSKWRDYYGRGRYSLQHAWKLDKLLSMARENGIHIHLVLDNHGKFSTYCDWEWDGNPYSPQGDPLYGTCSSPAEFFNSDDAKKGHKNKLRYIAARWGPDPTIMGFELVSEFDLVGGDTHNSRAMRARATFHKSAGAHLWVKEMLAALRKYDAYDHLASNHYATDYNWVDVDLATAKNEAGGPLFDYVITDAYRVTGPGGYVVPARKMQSWYTSNIAPSSPKPFWITEYGGNFDGATEAALDADVHCGLWATWMTEGAGTPLMWWFDFIDQKNLYTYYGAFAKYIAGEDRRGLKGVMTTLSDDSLNSQCYRWESGAYAWVYDSKAMMSMPPAGSQKQYTDIRETLKGLKPGTYNVEYWDCYEGKVAKSETIALRSGEQLHLKFPPFYNNMAIKVKLAK